MEEKIFAVATTPEMTERLTQLSQNVVALICARTKTPVEAFIVVDAARRQLEHTHNMALVAPTDFSQVGST